MDIKKVKIDTKNNDMTRTTPLGSLHDGVMYVEEKHPVIKRVVRLGFVFNALCLFLLLFFYWATPLFDPTEQAFFWAFLCFFIFGSIYAVFAQLFFVFARHIETEAVIRALTPNRRYKWHVLYDPRHEKDAEKAMEREVMGLSQKFSKTPSLAVGAGRSMYFHTLILTSCSLITCYMGVQAFIENMF